jgi:hypothetical protein
VKRFFERSHRLLTAPMGAAPRALALAAAVLVLPTFFEPLWNLTMFAPQYQSGLRLDIFSHKLQGGNGGQDLKEINLLNHYIGMRPLEAEDFTEFKWMPFVLGALALLFLRAAVIGRILDLVDATVLFSYFGLFSLWTFAYKLYRYGHELAPGAPVKVPGFTPPMIGGKQIANFEVYSYPAIASYAILAVGIALVAALLVALRSSWRLERLERSGEGAAAALPAPGGAAGQ